MFDFLSDSPILKEAARARLKLSFFGQMMIFWLVYLIGSFLATVPLFFYVILELILFLQGRDRSLSEEELEVLINEKSDALMASDTALLISLLSMALLILIVVIYCRLIERRPLSSLGIRRPVLSHVGAGLLGGALLFSALVGLCLLTGAVSFERSGGSTGMILLFFLGFLIQGAAEEFLLRAYLMPSLANVTSPAAALLMSAILFSLLHSANTGVGFLAYLNILLFGLFLGILVLRTGSIFSACAIHGAWNFLEGNIFGFPVSGFGMETTLLTATLNEKLTLTNGGLFGPEGGYAATLVLLAALIAVLYWPKKESAAKNAEANE